MDHCSPDSNLNRVNYWSKPESWLTSYESFVQCWLLELSLQQAMGKRNALFLWNADWVYFYNVKQDLRRIVAAWSIHTCKIFYLSFGSNFDSFKCDFQLLIQKPRAIKTRNCDHECILAITICIWTKSLVTPNAFRTSKIPSFSGIGKHLNFVCLNFRASIVYFPSSSYQLFFSIWTSNNDPNLSIYRIFTRKRTSFGHSRTNLLSLVWINC